MLATALKLFGERSAGATYYIFQGDTGRPLVLANLTRRSIVTKLKAKKISWSGWHGFRRGLATTLSDFGVPDKVTQHILRHASVEVTRKHYIKTSAQAEATMKKLAEATLLLSILPVPSSGLAS